MKRQMIAVITAATVTLGAAAPAVHAMEMEFNMLTGAVYNALQAQGFDTSNIHSLTLNEIVQIRSILESDMDTSQRQKIRLLLEDD